MSVMTKDGETYKGSVLRVWTDTYQIMSDIWGTAEYALVWAGGMPKTIVADVCDYGWSGPEGKPWPAMVDATPEVLAAYDEYAIERITDNRVYQLEKAAARVEKGATVKVTRGRYGKGAIGKVVFEMDGVYAAGYRSVSEKKYCIATSDRTEQALTKNGKVYDKYVDTVWAWARNVERLDVVPVDREAVKAEVVANYVRNFNR